MAKRFRRRSAAAGWKARAARYGAECRLPGRADYLQGIIDGRLPPPPFAELLGVDLVSGDEGTALFGCVPEESTNNTAGSAHGGLLCSLMDFACGCALETLLPAGLIVGTIEMKVSFMRPLGAGRRVEVRGKAVKQGRRIAFSRGAGQSAIARALQLPFAP